MDSMLPSPGFSIPSIGTPLHQPEEDQQIIANNSYPQYAPQMAPPPSMSGGLTPLMGGSGGLGSNNSNMGAMSNLQQNMGLPSLMHTPSKMMHSTYQPSYATPQSIMTQPQTPVNLFLYRRVQKLIGVFFVAKSNVTNGSDD